MRVVIGVIIFIAIVNNCDARINPMRGYVRSINKQNDIICDNKVLLITNNTEMFNCFRANTSNYCVNLANFSEFNNLKNDCMRDYNSAFGMGIFISIWLWVMIGLCCQH